MRARTSASQACGSMSLSFAVVISVAIRGAVGTAFGAGEQPGLAPESKAAQSAFGRVVGQVDASIVGEAGEPLPALEHIVDRPGDGGCARQPRALLAKPRFQRCH